MNGFWKRWIVKSKGLRSKGISCDLFMGSVYGDRDTGRSKTRYGDNINNCAQYFSLIEGFTFQTLFAQVSKIMKIL